MKRSLVGALALALLAASPAAARNLEDAITDLYGGDGIVLADPPNGHEARFTPPDNTQLDELARTISSGIGLFNSGTAVASFVFDPAQAIFVRAEDTLGPLVAERADTIGRNKINFGITYSQLKFKELEGQKLSNLKLQFDHFDTCAPDTQSPARWSGGDHPYFCSPMSAGGGLPDTDSNFGVPSPNIPGFERDIMEVTLDLELEQQIIALFANYGILDNWEVGLVLPLVETRIDVTARASLDSPPDFSNVHRFCTVLNQSGLGNPFDPNLPIYASNPSAGCDGVSGGNRPGEFRSPPAGFGPEPRDLPTSRNKDSAFGVGDLLMRAKWHALHADGWIPDLGVLTRITAPTGDEKELLGTGEWEFAFIFIASAKYGWVSPHANLGFQVSTGGSDFDDFRYVVGADFRLHERVTLAGDIIGRQTFTNDIVGSTLVDGSVGAKINVIGTLNLLGNVLIPINKSDGLRTDVTWTVGWEATF